MRILEEPSGAGLLLDDVGARVEVEYQLTVSQATHRVQTLRSAPKSVDGMISINGAASTHTTEAYGQLQKWLRRNAKLSLHLEDGRTWRCGISSIDGWPSDTRVRLIDVGGDFEVRR
ncbi:MAG: hypothetical protein KJ056_13815 [Acidimicrobiia bacterium]|nr:hypothetical protein [Acidimicrobiia bacterium]